MEEQVEWGLGDEWLLSDQYLQRELEKLHHDALDAKMLPERLTLSEMGHEIFNLIRSFSFVGDISEDPDDYVSTPKPQEGPVNFAVIRAEKMAINLGKRESLYV